MNHLYIVTHTDLDGAGSAAAAIIAHGRKPEEATILYAEPYNIHERLQDILEYVEEDDIVILSDLGPNKNSFEETVRMIAEMAGKGAKVYWYDHHIWDDEDKAAVERAGATLTVDTSTCATGVVARYATRHAGSEYTEYLQKLESAVCAADLWRWDNPLAPKLFRVADSRYSDEDRSAWRDRLVAKLALGILWDDELEERLQDYVSKELAGFNKVLSTVYVARGECAVAAAYKYRGPPSNSFIGASLISRHSADIAVIVRSNGGISLRSRRVNVQRIARALGGGGHPRAAGARLRIPLYVRIGRIITPRILTRYVAKRILAVAREVDACGGGDGGPVSARVM